MHVAKSRRELAEGEYRANAECDRLREINADLLAALERLGFNARLAGLDQDHPAMQQASAAISKALEEKP